MRGKTVLLAAAFAALIATPAFAQTTCKLQQLAELPVRMLGFRPVITARVNGIDGQFLVDTGAYDSVISKASAERFGLHATPAPIRLTLRGVGGEERDVGFAQAKDFGFATADIDQGGEIFALRQRHLVEKQILRGERLALGNAIEGRVNS